MPFDIEGAKSAGYTDQEIADHLAQSSKFDAAGARAAGYTDAEIIGHLSAPVDKSGPQQRYTNPNRGKSTFDLLKAGASRFGSDLAYGGAQLATQAAGAMGYPKAREELAVLTGMVDAQRMDPALKTTAGKVGYTGAALVPSVAAGFIPGANTMLGAGLIGAGMGLAQPTGSEDSRVTNTLLGGATGAVAQGAFNALGRIAQPVKKALTPAQARSVATLEDAGVPLDAAQRTGSDKLLQLRSMLSDNPFTRGGQRVQMQAEKSAFNTAVLEKIGANAKVADEAVMGTAYTKIGRVFDDIHGKYAIPFEGDSIAGKVTALEAQAKRTVNDSRISTIVSDLTEHAKANGGKIDGKFYQSIRGDLGSLEKQPFISKVAHDLRETLDDAFQKVAGPDDAAALQTARRQWRNMRIIENAVDSEGNISPSKLANQFGQKKNRYAGVYGKGDQSILDLARLAKSGKNIIPDKLPNSGTTPRALMQIAAPAVLGGAYGGYKEGDLGGVGMYALGGAALPFLAQKAINSPGMGGYLVNGLQSQALREALMFPSRAALGSTVPAWLLSQQ